MNWLPAAALTKERHSRARNDKLLLELPILWLLVGATQDDATLRGGCGGRACTNSVNASGVLFKHFMSDTLGSAMA